MHTAYCTSDDGLTWDWHGVALEGRTGEWDARGARVADVLWRRRVRAADAEVVVRSTTGAPPPSENWEEVTGIAVGRSRCAAGGRPRARARVTRHRHRVRYVSVVELDDGARRFYYEVTRSDGAHDLRTEYSPAP